MFDFPLESLRTTASRGEPTDHGQGWATCDRRTQVPCYQANDLGGCRHFGGVAITATGRRPCFAGKLTNAFASPPSARAVLYGDSNAIELVRDVNAIQTAGAVLPAWAARAYVPDAALGRTAHARCGSAFVDRHQWGASDYDRARSHLHAISLAQHYGLPTMGLDVTTELNVALFFALHQSQRDAATSGFFRREGGDRRGARVRQISDTR